MEVHGLENLDELVSAAKAYINEFREENTENESGVQ